MVSIEHEIAIGKMSSRNTTMRLNHVHENEGRNHDLQHPYYLNKSPLAPFWPPEAARFFSQTTGFSAMASLSSKSVTCAGGLAPLPGFENNSALIFGLAHGLVRIHGGTEKSQFSRVTRLPRSRRETALAVTCTASSTLSCTQTVVVMHTAACSLYVGL